MNPETLTRLPGRYRFGEFEFDGPADALRHKGNPVDIQPLPLALLRLLLQRPGELVNRSEVQSALWHDRVVEFDQSLNFCVRKLREVLDDDPDQPRYIQTVPRRGFRFVCPVRPVRTAKAWRWAAAISAVLMLAVGYLLLDRMPADRSQPRSAAAREAYLQGLYLLDQRQADATERAIERFERTLALEPDFADARAQAARAHYFVSQGGADRIDRVRDHLTGALDLDPDNPTALLMQGMVAFRQDWDLVQAEESLSRVLELQPEQRTALHVLPLVLAARNQLSEALTLIERYLDVDPGRAQTQAHAGWFYLLAGRHQDALVQCRNSIKVDPDWRMGHECAAHAALALGDEFSARQHLHGLAETYALSDAIPLVPGDDWLTVFYDRLLDWHQRNEPGNHFDLARIAAMAGYSGLARAQVEIMLEARDPAVPLLFVFPEFSGLRDDALYASLRHTAEQMGITLAP